MERRWHIAYRFSTIASRPRIRRVAASAFCTVISWMRCSFYQYLVNAQRDVMTEADLELSVTSAGVGDDGGDAPEEGEDSGGRGSCR